MAPNAKVCGNEQGKVMVVAGNRMVHTSYRRWWFWWEVVGGELFETVPVRLG